MILSLPGSDYETKACRGFQDELEIERAIGELNREVHYEYLLLGLRSHYAKD
jgi:hypothetical protein